MTDSGKEVESATWTPTGWNTAAARSLILGEPVEGSAWVCFKLNGPPSDAVRLAMAVLHGDEQAALALADDVQMRNLGGVSERRRLLEVLKPFVDWLDARESSMDLSKLSAAPDEWIVAGNVGGECVISFGHFRAARAAYREAVK